MAHPVRLTSLFVAYLGIFARSEALPTKLRIFNGDSVDIADYPYQLSVEIDGDHQCGASIIGEQWALTAAHCINHLESGNVLTLRAGSSFRGEGGYKYQVSEMIYCKNFTEEKLDCDIAVLKVSSPFILGDNVKIIPLATSLPAPGTMATVTGWGLSSDIGPLPHQLQMAQIPVLDQKDCKNIYGSFYTDNMMCAGILGTAKGPCQADSGGPLVVDGKQVGIVSFTNTPQCGKGTSPVVYDNIAHLRNWIAEHTGI